MGSLWELVRVGVGELGGEIVERCLRSKHGKASSTTQTSHLTRCTHSTRHGLRPMRRSPSPTLAPSTSTSPSSPRSRVTTLVCPRRDPSSPSTTATKRRMTRNRKIHPDNPNSIFLLTKKKKTY